MFYSTGHRSTLICFRWMWQRKKSLMTLTTGGISLDQCRENDYPTIYTSLCHPKILHSLCIGITTSSSKLVVVSECLLAWTNKQANKHTISLLHYKSAMFYSAGPRSTLISFGWMWQRKKRFNDTDNRRNIVGPMRRERLSNNLHFTQSPENSQLPSNNTRTSWSVFNLSGEDLFSLNAFICMI